MQNYKISELPYKRILGRTNGRRDVLTLFWNASGIELNVKASELWVTVKSDYETFEPWMDILINNVQTQRLMLTEGTKEYCVFRGLNPDLIWNVKILRDTQPIDRDPRMLMQILGLRTDDSAEFMPLREPSMRIEFIGDSITTGEGMGGALLDQDWTGQYMNAIDNYTFMTARELNAEYHVFSQSGWGVIANWENDARLIIPPYYEQVCGFLDPAVNEPLGALEKWNFASWQPDAVVINLGTNDKCAFTMPPFTDPDTGEVYKLHTLPDGNMDPADVKRFEDGVLDFLKMLRRDNPDAYLVWALGMLGNGLNDACQRAVDRFKAETGDRRADFLALPDTAPGEFGSRQHPGHRSHVHASRVLTAFLRQRIFCTPLN